VPRRETPRAADEWTVIRHLLSCRSGGKCEVCGRRIAPWPPWEAHHRLPRGMGGTTDPDENAISRLIVAHSACHAWCESRRADAASRGLLVLHGEVPSTVPLTLASGRIVYLDDQGLYLRPPDGEPEWAAEQPPCPSLSA